MKKKLAIVLAMVFVLGSTMTIFADIDGPSQAAAGQDVDVETDIDIPVIKVTVPTTVGLLLNPYQITYDNVTDTSGILGEDAEDAGDVIAAEGQTAPSSIISIPGTLVNESNVPMGVNVTFGAKSTSSSTITFASVPVNLAATTKSAFILFSIAKDKEDLKKAMVGPDIVATPAFKTAGANQIVMTKGNGVVKKDMITMDAKDGEEDEAVFAFSGNICTNLATGAWTAEDNVDVILKFAFTPKVYVAPEEPADP